MGTMHFDAEAKAELHSEAVKLIARYDSPLGLLRRSWPTTASLRLRYSPSPTGIPNSWR